LCQIHSVFGNCAAAMVVCVWGWGSYQLSAISYQLA
jgi:hypothetical protein